MKCPKCGYLGFESGDRCRNCGYEFSLSVGKSDPLDQPLDLGPDESRPPLDLDRIIGAPEPAQPEDLPLFTREDAPLITGPLRPRAPLGVRRATPEIPRARARPAKTPAYEDMLFETPRAFDVAPTVPAAGEALAAPARRVLAGAGRRRAALCARLAGLVFHPSAAAVSRPLSRQSCRSCRWLRSSCS